MEADEDGVVGGEDGCDLIGRVFDGLDIEVCCEQGEEADED